MLMTRQSFQNIRDTMVMPNDPLDMDLFLVNYQGFPISLRFGGSTFDLRLNITSVIGGWRQSVTSPGSPTHNADSSVSIKILDADKGYIQIKIDGEVLNLLDGYNYVVQMKQPVDPESAFKTIARGFIEVFNQ